MGNFGDASGGFWSRCPHANIKHKPVPRFLEVIVPLPSGGQAFVEGATAETCRRSYTTGRANSHRSPVHRKSNSSYGKDQEGLMGVGGGGKMRAWGKYHGVKRATQWRMTRGTFPPGGGRPGR